MTPAMQWLREQLMHSSVFRSELEAKAKALEWHFEREIVPAAHELGVTWEPVIRNGYVNSFGMENPVDDLWTLPAPAIFPDHIRRLFAPENLASQKQIEAALPEAQKYWDDWMRSIRPVLGVERETCLAIARIGVTVDVIAAALKIKIGR